MLRRRHHNALSSVQELKAMGFSTDFPPTKLRDGYGETVCQVLNTLLDHAFEKRSFKWGKISFVTQKARACAIGSPDTASRDKRRRLMRTTRRKKRLLLLMKPSSMTKPLMQS